MPKLLTDETLRGWMSLAVMTAAGAGAYVRALPEGVKSIIQTVRNDGPNDIDLDNRTRNYYEGLLDMDRESNERGGLAMQLAGFFQSRQQLPSEWAEQKEPIAPEPIESFLFRENIPGYDGTYKGCHFHMNQWGQRSNVEYTKEKPPGVFRITVCGGSNTMGYGVPLKDSFPYQIEQRLNRELSPKTGLRYEVINFSANGYHLPDKLYMATQRFAAFQPDLAIVDVLGFDLGLINYDYLGRRVREGRNLHFDFLKEIVRQAGAKQSDKREVSLKKLKPYRKSLVEDCFRELHRYEQQSGIPFLVLALRDDTRGIPSKLRWLVQDAEKEGLAVLPIYDSLEGGGMDMYVHPRDYHYSAKAHHLIADEIYSKMMANPRMAAIFNGPTRAQEEPPK